MSLTAHQRFSRAVVAAGLMVGMVAAEVAPASAAPPTSVDFTVNESLPVGSPGDLVISDIDGCPAGVDSVVTSATTQTDTGPLTTFRGTKIVDCGEGDSFSLTFRATSSACSSTDSGTWKLTGGTGIFAGAKGHGSLIGTYTLLDGAGTFCDNDGINDRYTGKIKLAS